MIGSKAFRSRELSRLRSHKNVPGGQNSSWEMVPAATVHDTAVLNHRLQQPLIEAIMLACEEVSSAVDLGNVSELTGIVVTTTDVYRAVKAEYNKRRKGKPSNLITKTAIPLPLATAEENEAARHSVPSKFCLGFEDRGDNTLTTRMYERRAFELPGSYAATHLYMPLDIYSAGASMLTDVNAALQGWKERHPGQGLAESYVPQSPAAFGDLPKLHTRTYLTPAAE